VELCPDRYAGIHSHLAGAKTEPSSCCCCCCCYCCRTIRDTTTTPAHVLVSNVFYPGGVIHTIGKVLIPTLSASG
jgi:hypothetical protein